MKRTLGVAVAALAAAGMGGAGIGVAATTAGAAPSPNAAPTFNLTWQQGIPDGGLHGSPIAKSSPNVASLGGAPAVVVGDMAGKVYAYNLKSGSPVGGWPYTAGAPVTSTPSVTPAGTVLVGTGNAAHPCSGGYQWIAPSGAHKAMKTANNPTSDTQCGSPGAPSGVEASMAVGTLQGVTATVAGSLGQNEWAFNAASTAPLNGFSWYQADSDFSTPAIGDVEGTGSNQIIEGGASSTGVSYSRQYHNGGHIRILRDTGNAGTPQPWGGLVCEHTTNQQVTSSPAIGKFLAGTGVGVVVGTGTYRPGASDTNKLIAINNGCGVAWTDNLAGTTTSSPALADVLGNGKLQVVATSGTGTVYAIDGANGHVTWQKNIGHKILGSPVTADLGGGHQDVLVASVNGLYVLTGTNGNILDTLKTTTGFQNSPLVTDTTGTIGVTAAGAQLTGSLVYHWTVAGTTGANVHATGAWPQFHHDPQLTGNAGTPPPVVEVTCKGQAPGNPSGYYLAGSDGGIFDYGNLPFCGSTGNLRLNQPIVDITAPKSASGYWEVASDGGLFTFGTLHFFGSMGGKPLNKPIVGMAAKPTGGGYWEVASDGGIFAFGNATFHGSMGGKPLNKPIVGMAATPTGGGYYEVASDGGIFAFGNATFHGSMGGKPLNAPIVGMAVMPTGGGYWEVASDGGIFAFGTAPFKGSMGNKPLNKPIVGMSVTPNGQGYRFVASDGGIFSFNAPFYGSMGGKPLNKPIVAMAGF